MLALVRQGAGPRSSKECQVDRRSYPHVVHHGADQHREVLGIELQQANKRGKVVTQFQPGWYPDHSQRGAVRWWDGRRWTSHTQPSHPGVVSRPVESVLVSRPAEPVVVSRPAEPVVVSRPAEPVVVSRPAEPVVVSRPAEPSSSAYDPAADPDTIWSAIGRPLTGIGAGRYKLTAEFLHFESGSLRTRAEQIRTHNIRDLDMKQSVTQKARSVGTIVVWHARGSGWDRVELEDIPNFREGVSALNEVMLRSRDELRVKEATQLVNHTQNVNHSGLPPFQQAFIAAPASASSPDLNSSIERLVRFHDSGVLSAEEFAAAKQKLLGL